MHGQKSGPFRIVGQNQPEKLSKICTIGTKNERTYHNIMCIQGIFIALRVVVHYLV